jgi:hypothetical protein
VVFTANKDDLISNSSNHTIASELASTVQDLHNKAVNNQLTRLENKECIDAYATAFLTQRRHLILVTDETPNTEPYYYDNVAATVEPSASSCAAASFEWICSGTSYSERLPCKGDFCTAEVGKLDPTAWKPFGQKVAYCLSETVDQTCTLQFSVDLAVVVIIFNSIKALTLTIIFFMTKENPLMTMGDAVTSFMSNPDRTTEGLCLMSKANVKWWERDEKSYHMLGAYTYDDTRKRWSTVVSKARWLTCMAL